MGADFWQIFAVMGGWSSAVAGVAIELHRRRSVAISQLTDRLTKAEASASAEHRALSAQVADTNQTIAEHYVRKDELAASMRPIQDDIRDMRNQFNDRLDRLFTRHSRGVDGR